MGRVLTRKQLKPRKPPSDAELLRRAERTAKAAESKRESERRRAAADEANRKAQPK